MGILLGILELIKVGIIYFFTYSFIFLTNGFGLFWTIISFIALLYGNVSVFFCGLAIAWVNGLIFHLATLHMKKK